jgi:hypothetical protein
VRHLSHELHPGVLRHAGLVAALNSRCAEFSAQQNIPVRFGADEASTESRRGVLVPLSSDSRSAAECRETLWCKRGMRNPERWRRWSRAVDPR